ncbi:MAG TPA: fatty acid desaturase [Burkholderiaceae bacterium]|nr:fatty acid desaturase [Burkholderiaceae bacterium]
MNFLGHMLANGLLPLSFWGYVLITLAMTHVTIAAVTIYLHRCQAHRALELHPVVSHFFRFWLWLTTGMNTREWAAVHRKHHARCDREGDPHSPQLVGLARVLFGGVFLYVREKSNRETLERYGRGTPDDWIERNLYSRHPMLGVVLMSVIDVLLFGELAGITIFLVQMAWIPFWAAGVINGVGHALGYRNWACPDWSTNIFPLGIVIGGEELHNNHHTFPSSAKLSNKWFEFDIGWVYIRALEIVGLAKVKHLPPKFKVDARHASRVDGATWQALVTCRYEVLGRYAQAMMEILRKELEAARRQAPERIGALRKLGTRFSRNDNDEELKRLDPLVAELPASSALRVAYAMRAELVDLWSRSSASLEETVSRLEDWCQRAEKSGVVPLATFAQALRAYAPSQRVAAAG